MDYRAYIGSNAWRTNPARLAELKAAGFRCRLCNDDGKYSPLEVHHRTYANLGDEQLGDLTTLCRICHRVVTDYLRRLRYVRRVPAIANVQHPLENSTPLYDPTFKETL